MSGSAKTLRQDLESQGAIRRTGPLPDLKLQLAGTAERPFSRKGWLFELKYDGYRLLVVKAGGAVKLLSRRGNDLSAAYPEVVRALEALPHPSLVLDGEVVVLDAQGRPSFQGMQKRAMLSSPREIAEAARRYPVVLYAFDLLGFEDLDLRKLKLLERKAALRSLLPAEPASILRFSDHVEERGEDFFEQVAKLDLEGVMAKKADAPYEGGRTSTWLKVTVEHHADLAIIGFSPPEGSRLGFGALHLGAYEDDQLVYVGRVGSGFTDKDLQEFLPVVDVDRLSGPPCPLPPLTPRGSTWVRPRLVCEVKYKLVTDDGQLRAPVFVRMRDDKEPEECEVPPRVKGTAAVETDESLAPDQAPPVPSVKLARLSKLFWPDDGYTKGDLVQFYSDVAPWLLPYLRDRPLVVTRYPDGIAGKSFFQKDATRLAPPWVKSARVFSEVDGEQVDAFVVNDADSLLYVANLAAIPLHLWSARLEHLDAPDWCILDLDPKGAPFEDVVEIALAIRALCDEIGLPSFPKTSGSSGLHVLLPLGRQIGHEQSVALGQLLATVIARQLPRIATIIRSPIEARGGRVYIDFLQNGAGKLIASPFCVRPLKGAPVSATLSWDEVVPPLRPTAFTIRNVIPRLRERGDPMAPVLELKPDLRAALGALEAKLRRK
ncbi:MAG TPA: DNA ligase D [Myxococcaceae bacterium]